MKRIYGLLLGHAREETFDELKTFVDAYCK